MPMTGDYRSYFEEMPCYVSVHDRQLRIVEGNRRFREDFDHGIGDPCYAVYKGHDGACDGCPVLLTFEDGESHASEQTLTTALGFEVPVMVHTTPIRDGDGEIVAVMEMHTDITQLRQLQSQLTSIGLLVGSISHGIKGLLTGLDGGIYLVNTGFARDNPQRVEKGWEMVQRNADRIRTMVQDILYFAKDRDLDVVDIDAGALACEIRDLMEKKAGDLDVEMTHDIAADVGTFEGDTHAIRAMLVNLLENSLDACRVERTRDGHHVRFAVRRAEPWIEFEIADDGIGMDRETREKIFSLFYSSKGIEGTGLGLFISNKIVEKHGGTIDVDSEPGAGTRFRVRIPLAARPSTRPPEAEPD